MIELFLVNVYDDERKTHVLELCFSLSVVSIRMSRSRFNNRSLFLLNSSFYSRLIVVLVSKIHIFSFPNQCRLLHTIETRDNPRGKSILLISKSVLNIRIFKGLCELSNNDGSLLVFPFNAKTKGGFVQFLVSQRKSSIYFFIIIVSFFYLNFKNKIPCR